MFCTKGFIRGHIILSSAIPPASTGVCLKTTEILNLTDVVTFTVTFNL